MADTLKLAQSNPAAATATTLLTASANAGVVISNLTVCNRSATSTTFRISITPAAGTDDQNDQFLYCDIPILGNDTLLRVAGDVIVAAAANMGRVRVYAAAATLTFSASYVEVT